MRTLFVMAGRTRFMTETLNTPRTKPRRRTGVTNHATYRRESVHLVGLIVVGLLALAGLYGAFTMVWPIG